MVAVLAAARPGPLRKGALSGRSETHPSGCAARPPFGGPTPSERDTLLTGICLFCYCRSTTPGVERLKHLMLPTQGSNTTCRARRKFQRFVKS